MIRIAIPFFYSSLTTHTLIELSTKGRKIVLNPTKYYLFRLSKPATEFKEFSEKDKICFIKRSMTSSHSDCFPHPKKDIILTYPKLMLLGQKRVWDLVAIANSFHMFFGRNFITSSFNNIAYSSTEIISLKDFKFSIRPDLILIEITRTRPSAYLTNHFFPAHIWILLHKNLLMYFRIYFIRSRDAKPSLLKKLSKLCLSTNIFPSRALKTTVPQFIGNKHHKFWTATLKRNKHQWQTFIQYLNQHLRRIFYTKIC